MEKHVTIGILLVLVGTSLAWNLMMVQAIDPGVYEIIYVDATESGTTTSTQTLKDGSLYVLTVTGTWTNDSHQHVDAKHWSQDETWTTVLDAVDAAGADELELLVDNVQVAWSGDVGTHTYTVLYEGTGAPVTFRILETGADAYTDNEGGLTVTISYLEIEVDIKPGSCPNSINLKSRGVIPLAILGREDFDVTSIDPATIRFKGDWNDDLATGVPPLRWAREDVNDDGLLDLIFHFKTQALVTGNHLRSDSQAAYIVGETETDTQFWGVDSVRIVPPAK